MEAGRRSLTARRTDYRAALRALSIAPVLAAWLNNSSSSPARPRGVGCSRRRGDRIEMRFAAVHESLVGTFETSRDVRSLVAIGGKAEVTRTSSNRRGGLLTDISCKST